MKRSKSSFEKSASEFDQIKPITKSPLQLRWASETINNSPNAFQLSKTEDNGFIILKEAGIYQV